MKEFKNQYDERVGAWYICDYLPYGLVKSGYMVDDAWRATSYSPEILDYKLGQEKAIKQFSTPLSELIIHALNAENIEGKSIFLVPIPSSKAENDPNFKRTSGKIGDKNRDDRNVIFCQFIKNELDKKQKTISVSVFDGLKRIVSILPKDKGMPDSKYAKTMEVQALDNIKTNHREIFILIDDVITYGRTFRCSKSLMMNHFPNSEIINVAIGKTASF